MKRPNARKSVSRKSQVASMDYNVLEERRLLVIGFNTFAPEVPRGGEFDGVVFVNGCTGSLLTSSRHILTAAHCSWSTQSPTPTDSFVQFDLQRSGSPVNIRIDVPVANQIVPTSWNGNSSNGNDIAIYGLTDTMGRSYIAPFGAQRYGIWDGNPLQNYTMVGYGETGTGAIGEHNSEVQRVTILNRNAGTFRLSFGGNQTVAIPQNADAETVRLALNPLIAGVNVSNKGLPVGTWDIRFRRNPGVDQPLLTGDATGGATVQAQEIAKGGTGSGGIKRWGMNTYDADSNPAFPGVNGLLFSDFDDGSAARNRFGGLGTGENETFEARGDSGGPGFIRDATGQLWIASVVSATPFSGGTFDINAYQVRDNSFGEGNVNTNARFFRDSFINPQTAGAFHALIDMNFQVLGRDGIFENLQFDIFRDGLDVVVTVNNLTDPGVFSGEYFRARADELTGLTIVGGSDNETFVVHGNLGVNLIIEGGGGADKIIGADSNLDWNLTGFRAGNVPLLGLTFSEISSVVGGSGRDVFTVGFGLIDIEVDGGGGNNGIVGPNLPRTWQLTGTRQGRLETSEVSFVAMASIDGGSAADQFILGTGNLDLMINGRGGIDSIQAPNQSRVFSITGSMQGNINISNVQFEQVEDLRGGNGIDWFIFTSNASRIRQINGGQGQDIIDYRMRDRVTVRILGLGDHDGASGFRGFGTSIDSDYRNIGQIIGSNAAIDDILIGADLEANWFYHPNASSYQTNGRALIFRGFEGLLGGNLNDSFVVRAPDNATLTIVGGNPTVAPGDRLRVELSDVVNPQWTYFSPGAGRFNFDNKMPVVYSGIETLDMFDWGDAPTSYGTLHGDGGARHRLGTPLRLGSKLDPETNGQPSLDARGDDNNGSPNDEDGVVLPTTLIAHFRAAANVFASMAGKLDAWIDFNRDGVFATSEKIAHAFELSAGWNRVEFYVPWESANEGLTFARFRISSIGGLAATGLAEDGEVEDYQVHITKVTPGTSALLPDPFFPGTTQTMLVMAGTAGNDTIVVNPDNQGRYHVRINGIRTSLLPAESVNRIGSYGLSGNDTIVVTSTMLTPSELYGGEGNDDLFGGAADDYIRGGNGNDRLFGHGGNDLLFGDDGDDRLFGHDGDDILSGGAGDDWLYGGNGADLLFGGSGADWLYGQDGEDLLVGNTSIYDNDASALMRLRNAWTRPDSYLDRVDQILNGTSVELIGTGILLHFGTTILDDGDRDRFFGGLKDDWFVGLGFNDTIMDYNVTEIIS